MTSNEDFLFAQEALAQGFVTDAQVEEGLLLQRRMAEDLKLDERLGVILVKRGYLAEDQARRVYARIQPSQGPGQIQGYRLLDVVGRGAMGTVYRALHLGLNREVAIKILRPDLAGDRTQVERLKGEAAMLASLDHPNIVRALDAGESNGFPYVVMEFVEGETLRDRLRREGPLPETEALRITRALADALERARRMGVVHRDVKPGNVLMTRAGAPKLMDLGLAKGPVDLGLTQHGATVGTPQYIAPEQAIDPRKADTRSDIYALGATLYAMLTGRPPFDGQTLAEVLTKVLYEVPTPVRTLRPEVSPETGYLVERMMLRDPGLRYRTPAQVVADIDRLTGGTSILPQGFSGNWEAYLLRRRVRRTTLLAGGAVAAAVAVAVGIHEGLAWKQRERARSDVTARLTLTRWDVSPAEARADLSDRLRRAEDLLRDSRATGAGRSEDLEGLVRRLREEVGRLDALDRLVAERVQPAVAAGEFAAADTALKDFVAGVPVYGPARRLAEARQRDLLRASDDALLADRRERAFPSEPRDLEDVSEAAARWRDRTATRYAPSQVQREEHRAAQDASEAARRIQEAVRAAERSLDDAWLDRGLADLRLAGLEADVAAARAGAQAVLRDEGPALTGSDRRYVLGSRLLALVEAPFTQRAAAVDARVGQAWARTLELARDRSAAGEHAAALQLLVRFARASEEGGAFPELARAARAAHDELEARTRSEVGAAQEAIESLARDVVRDLRTGDLGALDRRVAAARAVPDVFRPVAGALDELLRVPEAWRGLEDAVVQGLSTHVGPDPSLWLDSLQFRGDPQPEHAVELVEVKAEDGSLTFKTHRGRAVQGPFRRLIADVAEEDAFRLAGRASDAPEDRWLLALHGLATLPLDAEDFYVALPALATAAERFERAGTAAGPLAAWVARERDAREKEAAENEAAAEEHLRSAREAMAARAYGDANYHFRALLDRSVEPGLKLPFTRVARQKQNREYVDAQIGRILGELNVDLLEVIWPGARVTRRPTSQGDALDVDVLFDFDRKVQVRNFLSGWARLAPAGQGRVLTPDAQAPGWSLRLNPDSPGEIVRDRPVTMECPFDQAYEMAVSFLLWPETPIFHAIDLDGAQVGILSADPRTFPAFPPDVPLLEREKSAPHLDVYGRGRGVMFRAATDFGDPERWGWDDGYQGRHFVPPDVDRPKRRDALDKRWFAFESRERPYKVKFTWLPGKGVRLEVDDREVWRDESAALRAPKPSGRIRILSYTPCLLDDLVLSGRIEKEWLERMKAQVSRSPSSSNSKGETAPR